MDNRKTIYADYQATTPVDPRVLKKMAPCWGRSFGNPHSSDHVIGWRAEEAVREAAASVAALIGADADEVVFTSGATEANNLALLGLARRAPGGRRRILVSAIEHKCVLGAARALSESEGITVDTLAVDSEGFIDFDVLEERLDRDILLLSLMAVNNEVGTIQDIPRIAKLLTPYGILFHCDAAQAPCGMDVSDLASHADLISLSAHKMYGPQGIGGLYVRRDLKESIEPLIYGGGQQEGLRSGTVPMPLCVGMATAAGIIADEKRSRNAHGSLSSVMRLFACYKPEILRSPSTEQLAHDVIRVMPTSALMASMRRTLLVSFSRDLPHPQALLARPVFPNHRMYFAHSD